MRSEQENRPEGIPTGEFSGRLECFGKEDIADGKDLAVVVNFFQKKGFQGFIPTFIAPYGLLTNESDKEYYAETEVDLCF